MAQLRSAVVGGALVLAGVALGALVFRSEPVGAQTSGYRECVIGKQEVVDINDEGRWDRQDVNFQMNRIIRIPNGWEVVGVGGVTAANSGFSAVMICRR